MAVSFVGSAVADSSGGSITFPSGAIAGLAADDLLMIFISDEGLALAVTLPTWTTYEAGNSAGPPQAMQNAFYKVAVGSGSTSITITPSIGGTAFNAASAIMIALRGADTSPAARAQANGSGDPPSLSGFLADEMALAVGFKVDTTTVPTSAPSGYTGLVTNSHSSGSASSAIAVARKAITSAGTENPAAFGGATTNFSLSWTIRIAEPPTLAEGALSKTFANATLAATATVKATGALTTTLSGASLSAAGSILIGGSLTTTLVDTGIVAAGAATIKADADIALDNTNLAATGSAPNDSLNVTLEDTTLTASANVAVGGTASITAGDMRLIGEPERTNLFLYSEEHDQASWSKLGVNVTANQSMGPTSLLTLDKVTETTSSTSHQIYQSKPKAAAPTTHTVSWFVRAAERSWCYLVLQGSGSANRVYGYFNLATGEKGSAPVSGSMAYVDHGIEDWGGGLYRIWLTGTSDSITSIIGLLSSGISDAVSNFTGVVGNGIYAGHAQLEEGGYATSYIATTTGPVTRPESPASASVLVSGQADTLLENMTSDSAGTVQVRGTLDAAGDGTTLSGTGDIPIIGALNVSLDGTMLAASGGNFIAVITPSSRRLNLRQSHLVQRRVSLLPSLAASRRLTLPTSRLAQRRLEL